ncbi:MAG: CoB--CoM heterodisulfide reductase iron-sulfur subunit A family protein [Bacteroidales bacterium]|nr:CoB--CoM heterodisulfide reductase iron-sulfur subunit A family protein [Bacteroidales bacterium]
MQKTKPVLVIGGGISGITAAVEIAEVGRKVVLVEQKPYLGGNVIQMNNYFPKLCPPSCGLEINFRRIRQNPRITYYVNTKVIFVSGKKGNFLAKLRTAPQYIFDNCAACGDCASVCPQNRPDDFNYGYGSTKAAYLPHDMAFPFRYHIDERYCKKETCNKCVEACDYNAIDLSAEGKEFEIEAASVIVATGWTGYDARKIENLHYADFQNVITNVEFERLIAVNGPGKGELHRPSDGKIPESVCFVQCAGSRDENHLPYCSAVCCSASLKHALTIHEKYPECRIRIFYIDLRIMGRNEDFLAKVEAVRNIELIKGKVAGIEEISGTKNLIVEAEDIMSGKKVRHETGLVVLATGIVPSGIETVLNVDQYGFVPEVQAVGMYATACCKKPMDVASSLRDATGAALKAIQY